MTECYSSCKKINSKTKQHVCVEFSVWFEKTRKETICITEEGFWRQMSE